MVELYSGCDEARLCELGDLSSNRFRSPDRLQQETRRDQMDGRRKSERHVRQVVSRDFWQFIRCNQHRVGCVIAVTQR